MCVLIFFSTKLLNSNITSFLLKYWFVYQFIQGINWFFLHFWEYIALKGPTTVFLSDPPCKDGNSIWCLGWKTDYFYCRFSSSVTWTFLLQEGILELFESYTFKPRKVVQYLLHYSSDKSVKGTVVNHAMQFLQEGSHEITLSVPSRAHMHNIFHTLNLEIQDF